MIGALARFVEALRADGIVVSPAEMLDASRAMDAVGLEERATVKRALRATLAKDRRQTIVFDRVFDRYFPPPRVTRGGDGEGRPGAAGERPRPGASDRAAKSQRKVPPPEDRPRARHSGAESETRAPHPRPSDRAPVARAIEPLPGQGRRRDGRLRRIISSRPTPREAGDPRLTDLAARLTTDEERRIAREVPALVQAIRLHAGRRLERARTGRPWLRRVLRENLSRGGVPFVIPFRAERKRKTRVVLLVDVSHSVARAAGFFLALAGEFVALGRRARIFAFVAKPVDATTEIARWISGDARARPDRRVRARGERPGAGIERSGVTFADLLEGIRDLNLSAPSDYGRAFHSLLTSRHRPRGRDTVLVILGDGRTNRFEPLPWALRELAAGCRGSIWLVSEPASRWGTADSALAAFLPEVDLAVEAKDLDGIARGVAALVRKL